MRRSLLSTGWVDRRPPPPLQSCLPVPFQENVPLDSTTHSFSSSSIVTYSKVGNEPPKVFQASSSTRCAPGGVRTATPCPAPACDVLFYLRFQSTTLAQIRPPSPLKRCVTVNRSRRLGEQSKTRRAAWRRWPSDITSTTEDTWWRRSTTRKPEIKSSTRTSRTWMSVRAETQRGTQALRHSVKSMEMLPDVLLTLHPQLKNCHSKMSGSRRCPASTRPSPRPSWRDRALASCATQPSPALRSLTGGYHELRDAGWGEAAILNRFPLLLSP